MAHNAGTGRERRELESGNSGPYTRYYHLGWQFVFSFLMFAVPGFFLDRWLKTEPVFLLIGVFLGMFGMFALLYKVAAELSRNDKKPKKDKQEASEDTSHASPA